MVSTLLLADHPLSPYAQKIRILLREKGLAFECQTPGAGFASKLNARAEIPSLTHDGMTIFDSTIILEYLEETFPGTPMLPPDPKSRARLRMIEDVADTHWEAINWGLSEVRYFNRGGAALGPALHAAGVTQAGHMYGWLEGLLGNADWLSGADFGWADLSVIPHATMSSGFGIDPPAGSKTAAWLARGLARPSVAQTVAEALASVPQIEAAGKRMGVGFRRQFRDHRLEWMIRSGGLQVVVDGLAADNIRFTDTARFAGQTS